MPPDQNSSFETHGFIVLRNFISEEERLLCLSYLDLAKKAAVGSQATLDDQLENDKNHPKTFSFYSPLCTEVMLLTLLPRVEAALKVPLVPSFSYARTYYRGSHLEKHIDRSGANYGISICLKKDGVLWPLNIIGKTGSNHSLELEEGDAAIFLGMELEHFRNEFSGEAQTQMFLFYLPKNDTPPHLYFDGRTSLGAAPASRLTKMHDRKL